jgi:hypothetical protein
MDRTDWLLAVLETVIWYGFLWYLLFAIRRGTTLWQDAAVLLALAYLGTMLCPWVHRTRAWEETVGNLR